MATGQALAAKLGLGAPLIDSWLQGDNTRAVLRRQLPPALAAGIAVAVLMIIYSSVILPMITDAATLAKMTRFDVPLATRILYGGITEELLTRWGLMSFFAWALWRMTGSGEIRSSLVWAAIIIAAALFAMEAICRFCSRSPLSRNRRSSLRCCSATLFPASSSGGYSGVGDWKRRYCPMALPIA